MKGKLLIFMAISFCCANHILAQRFEIPFPQKSDKFTKAFVTALNNAPNKFVKLKGSLIFRYDSIHKQSKVYKCNLNIPGANAARYIEDSTYYLEYFFGEYSNLDEATGAMNALTAKLQTSLSDRAVVIMNKKGWDKLIKENKIGYVYQNGFFHYNVSIQLTTISNSSNIRLVLQIFHGRPVYYNWITPNLPIGGFNFINAVKNTYAYFADESKTPCPNEIPPYICKGKAKSQDTTYVAYYKKGFDGIHNAGTEYDVTFSNLESGLGHEYVYWSLPCKAPAIKQYAFVKYDDVDKSKRKTILLTLYNNGLITQTNNPKSDLVIELAFAY